MNGKEAVDFYQKCVDTGKKLDLIMMDIEMPVMNGKDAAQKIREIEYIKHIKPSCKIIFVSGNALAKEIEECTNKTGKIKGNAFMKKPVTFEIFQSNYNKVMN
mmetsp:Transcript_48861/g.67883  ORF Transcript_48861/g.67883 Transcript_48861/m.67883 type:complete len:103 (+) Transcript_48861:79-387(+)